MATELNVKNFDEAIKNPLVLVDFWANWCMPCKIIAPTVEQLASELAGKVKVAKCNVDDAPEIATNLSVLNIPTLVVFKGGEEVARIIGVNSKEAITAKIQAVV